MSAFHNLTQLYARPGFLLRRAHQISAAVFEDECRSVGLTPAQFGVLSVLRCLETGGLIARAPAPASRRNLAISLSVEGLALLKQAQEPADRAYNRLMAPLNKAQRIQLVELLQMLTTGLENDARAAFVPPEQESTSTG